MKDILESTGKTADQIKERISELKDRNTNVSGGSGEEN